MNYKEFFNEAIRYYNNANDLLKKARPKEGLYQDKKHLQEACGTAYLAALKAIDAYLLKYGVEKEKLPQSVDTYRLAINKMLSRKNGRLRPLKSYFNEVYEVLHIHGYYRAMSSVKAINKGFDMVKEIIEIIKHEI